MATAKNLSLSRKIARRQTRHGNNVPPWLRATLMSDVAPVPTTRHELGAVPRFPSARIPFRYTQHERVRDLVRDADTLHDAFVSVYRRVRTATGTTYAQLGLGHTVHPDDRVITHSLRAPCGAPSSLQRVFVSNVPSFIAHTPFQYDRFVLSGADAKRCMIERARRRIAHLFAGIRHGVSFYASAPDGTTFREIFEDDEIFSAVPYPGRQGDATRLLLTLIYPVSGGTRAAT